MATFGAVAVAWPWPLARAQQQKPTPVVGFLSARLSETSAPLVAAFHQGLTETAYVEGQNVAIEYRLAEGGMIGCLQWPRPRPSDGPHEIFLYTPLIASAGPCA